MLELSDICKDLGEFGLRNISIRVGKGDYFVLLGESGAGKSVILETIAGLIDPDSGTILLDGVDITNKKIQKRNIGLVFQDHSIFPHLTVKDNINYTLHGTGLSASARKQRILEIAERLEIIPFLHRRPEKLSGGELQRVALARTLVQRPHILLLDEPLASLDARIKGELRALLRQINNSGQTILHVTHDYEEALSLGTRIAVIDKGIIVQEGTPDDVFHHPRSAFVARFTGIKNFLPARAVQENDRSVAYLSMGRRLEIQPSGTTGEGFVIIRGEDVILAQQPAGTSAVNQLEGVIREIIQMPLGMEVMIDAGFPLYALVTRTSVGHLGLTPGMNIWVHFKASAVRFIEK